jgi:hypothetical protein
MKLDRTLVKNLLQDVEKSGKTRSEFNLAKLVTNNPYIYGEPGSDKRRSVQKGSISSRI